jgi:4-amino-4-deoxy-L-arabinose transferase-like glycosyltransferase
MTTGVRVLRRFPRSFVPWRPELAVTLLLVGLVLQRIIVRSAPTTVGLPLLILAGLGTGAALLINALDTAPSLQATEPSPVLARFWLSWGGAYLGILIAATAAREVSVNPQAAQWIWLVAVAFPVAGLIPGQIATWRVKPQSRPRVDTVEIGIVVALFVGALLLRTIDILGSPPFVHVDEANCALSAEAFMHGASLLSLGFFNLPMMSYAYLSLGIHLFNDPLVGIRVVNAVLGALGVVLLYLLGRELFGRRAGVIAAVLLSVAFLHVEFSRDGIHNIQAPTCFTLTMLLLVLVLRRGGALTALLLGMSMALDFQVYWAARIAPMCVVVFVLILLVLDRRRVLARWTEALWSCVGCIVAFTPVFAVYSFAPALLLQRERQLSLLTNTPDSQAHLQSVYHTTQLLPILWLQAWRTVSTFNFTPDASPQIGWTGSMLDWVTAALLPAALALAVLRCRRPSYLLPALWIGAVLGAAILSSDPPWWPRLLALLPALFLVIGALLDRCWTLLITVLDSKYLAAGWIGAAVLLSAIVNLHTVFVAYPNWSQSTSEMQSTLVARFLNHAPGASSTVLLSNPTLFITYQTIQFLAPHAGGCTVLSGQSFVSCPVYRSSRLFVALPGREDTLKLIERRRPGGHTVPVGPVNSSSTAIWAYELPPPPKSPHS